MKPAYYHHSQEERDEIHEAVCKLIEMGVSGVRACETVGVDRGLWSNWVVTGKVDFSRYAHARELGADYHAEGIVETAEMWSRIDPAAARVVVDAKKWVAARMYPKRWGDKLDITSGGEKVSPIVALPAVTLIPDKLEQAEEAEVLEVAELPRLPDAT